MESRTTSFGEGDSEGHTGLAMWPSTTIGTTMNSLGRIAPSLGEAVS